MKRGLGLRHTAAAHLGKHLGQQEAGHHADQRRHQEQPYIRWCETEEQMIGTLNRQREEHRRQAGDDADDDRERQEQLILTQPQLL